jgi:hypothetical protein
MKKSKHFLHFRKKQQSVHRAKAMRHHKVPVSHEQHRLRKNPDNPIRTGFFAY